jgi:hypothetical protein
MRSFFNLPLVGADSNSVSATNEVSRVGLRPHQLLDRTPTLRLGASRRSADLPTRGR